MNKNRLFRSKLLFTTALCSTVCVACSGGGSSTPANESNLDTVDSANTDSIGTSASALIAAVQAIESSPPIELPAEANAAIEYVAHLYITQSQGATELDVSALARFYQSAVPLDNAPVLQLANNLDTCEIGSESSQFNAQSLDVPLDHIISSAEFGPIQTTTLNAGQAVELTADAGSYMMLSVDDSSADAIEYKMQDGAVLNVPVPDQLNVSVPGDAFPALQWLWTTPALLDVSLRTALRSVDTNPTLAWQAPEIPSDALQGESITKLQIYAGSINELTGEYQSFQCELADDGEFTLPADVQALYADGFNANFVDVVRTTRTLTLDRSTSIVNVFVQKY